MPQTDIDAREAPENGSAEAQGAQHVLFVAGGSVFALALENVLKVIEPEWWVRIPHAAPWAEGLLYHHGDPLVVANAGALLEGRRSPRDAASAVLRLGVPGAKLGILVERVLGIWRTAAAASATRESVFVKGVWERRGGVVNQIDFEALADRASRIFEK